MSYSLDHGQSTDGDFYSWHQFSACSPVLSTLFFWESNSCIFSTVTQKTEAFSFSSHFLNLLCINKKPLRNILQLALPQMHSSVKSTQHRASFLQVGNLMPPLTTFIYLKLIARSGKLSVLCIECMIMQILKTTDLVSVTGISKPEIEREFSEQNQEHLRSGEDKDREKDLKLIQI